jgi:hypothetical protein
MISDPIIFLNDFSVLTSIFTVKLLCRCREMPKPSSKRKLAEDSDTPTRKFKKANSQKI